MFYRTGDSLSGNEINTYKADGDDGAAEIPDPVEAFCKAVTANRFGTTPEGAPLKKRWADNDSFVLAIQKAARMRKEGTVMKLFDAAGNLLARKRGRGMSKRQVLDVLQNHFEKSAARNVRSGNRASFSTSDHLRKCFTKAEMGDSDDNYTPRFAPY